MRVAEPRIVREYSQPTYTKSTNRHGQRGGYGPARGSKRIQGIMERGRPSAGFGRHAQLHPRFLLQGAHDAEEILGARVAARSQHPVQTLARFLDCRGQLLETERGIDQVAQNGLAGGRVASEKRVDRLRQERLAKARIALRASRHSVLKIPCKCHTASPPALTHPCDGDTPPSALSPPQSRVAGAAWCCHGAG